MWFFNDAMPAFPTAIPKTVSTNRQSINGKSLLHYSFLLHSG